MKPLLKVFCVFTMFLLGGCTGFKQMVGLESQPPDEFAVESRAPLTIPPEFDLRPPAPGAPRPQDVSPAAKAQQAMNAAGPGKPGDQASSGLGSNSALGAAPLPGQQLGGLARALLSSNDVNTGVTIDKRETTPIKGVY
ncbi:MAG TPA: DUF3035 domain-containing protein [Stellaceae bacterium]|nr:DUF3035 domain-containing protein [Stellaceae bacterium]